MTLVTVLRRNEVGAYDLLMGELRAMDTDLYSAFTSLLPDDFDFFLSVVKSHITGSFRYRNSVTFSSCAMTGCNCLQQFLLMNILVQAEKYANEFATGCNSFIAAFILFYFTCAAGLRASLFGLSLVFLCHCVYFLLSLTVNTNAINCMKRLHSKVILMQRSL